MKKIISILMGILLAGFIGVLLYVGTASNPSVVSKVGDVFQKTTDFYNIYEPMN